MRFVVQHGVGDPRWVPELLEPAAVTGFARAAEEGGFHGLALTDHPAPSGGWVRAGGEGSIDPLTGLGFCAAVTSTIRLMTMVLVLGYRNPYLTAHQAETVDHLSGGRLTLGLGTGYLRGEFRALGADPDTRREVFDEALAALIELWSNDGVASYRGSSFSGRDTHVHPGVVQRPHPPLWFHGNGPFGRERAARYGQGWLGILTDDVLAGTIRTVPMPDLDAFGRAVDDLRTRTEKAGRSPEELAVCCAGLWPMVDIRKGWDTDRYLADVAAAAERGANWVFLLTCGDDPAAAEETVRRFAEEVVRPASG